MEDKHVCIPDFNMLFNLEVKGTSGESMRFKKQKEHLGGPVRKEELIYF